MKFTRKTQSIFKKSPYVVMCSDKTIRFTDEFKEHFIEEYKKGKGPTGIFREAGFDTTLLGAKRIERCAARWRESYGVETNNMKESE